MKYLIVPLLIFLCGCNESKSTAAASTPRSIFSDWIYANGNTAILDLSAGEIGVSFVGTYGDCQYDTEVTGTEFEGEISYSNSTYIGSGADPGCNGFELASPLEFRIESGTLYHCENNSCEEFIDPNTI